MLQLESPVEVAIGQANGIMQSLVDNEEAIADAIADTDGRALDDLRGFLTVMADGEAVCSLSFRNEVFGFRDVGQVLPALGGTISAKAVRR